MSDQTLKFFTMKKIILPSTQKILFLGFAFCLSFSLSNFNLFAQSISVSPDNGDQGDYITVTVSGTGVNFGQGSSCLCPSCLNVNTSNVVFQQGSSTLYTISVYAITSSSFKADIYIPTWADTGKYDVYAGIGYSCSVFCSDCFTVNYLPPPPSPIISINPDTVESEQTIDVTVSGTNITFGQGSSCMCPSCINVSASNVTFTQGSSTIIVPTSIGSVTPGSFVATISLPPGTPLGNYDVNVGDDVWCGVSCYDCLTIICATPSTPDIILIGSDSLKATVAGVFYEWKKDGVLLSDNTQTIKTSGLGVYTVRVRNSDGCYSAFSNGFNVNSLEEKDFQEQYKLFPNPVNGLLNLSVEKNLTGDLQIAFKNILGQEVVKYNYKNIYQGFQTHFDLSDLSSGIYFIQLRSENKFVNYKIFVE